MQNYDEKYFKARANRNAGTTWLTLLLIVTVYYAVKMSEGVLSKSWFIILCSVGWLIFLGG